MSGCGYVVFDYGSLVLQYPELSSVTSSQAQLCFNTAELYLNNTATSPVPGTTPSSTRGLLLGMLTAHLAKLTIPLDGTLSPLVGRISNASEGSVSVAVDMPSTINSAWFQQTTYGALFWQACSAFRQGGRYFPGARRNCGGRGGFW